GRQHHGAERRQAPRPSRTQSRICAADVRAAGRRLRTPRLRALRRAARSVDQIAGNHTVRAGSRRRRPHYGRQTSVQESQALVNRKDHENHESTKITKTAKITKRDWSYWAEPILFLHLR